MRKTNRGKKEGTVGYTSRLLSLRILEDLFWRQPNVWATSIGYFRGEWDIPLEVPDGEGGCKRIVGFIIRVTEKVDQSALPPEDRIPDTIEGVPVQIIEVPEGFNFPAP